MYRACLFAVVGVAVYRSRCGDRVQGGRSAEGDGAGYALQCPGTELGGHYELRWYVACGPDTVTGCGTEAEAVVVGGIAA